jgi:hypothetical protein
MNEDDLEIIIKPASWRNPGMPARWHWQVRQKHPSKFLVKGLTAGSVERAQEAAEAAKARILENATELKSALTAPSAAGLKDPV